MTVVLFGYKRLLCLVSFVVYVVRVIDAATLPSGRPTLTTAYSDGGQCIDHRWERHEKRCYLFMAEKYNFTVANKSCSEQGAHLVSISDYAENQFIMSLRRSSTEPAWIGLYKQTSRCDDLASCDWMWLDGSQLGYYNWPVSTYPTVSQCVIIEASGFWGNGRGCDAELDVICEGDVWYPTTTSEATSMTMTTYIADPSSTISAINEAASREHKKKEKDMPIIVGCVVGGLVLVVIVVVVVVLLKRHRTSSQADQPVEDKDEETPPVAKHVRYNPSYEDVDLVKTQGETNVTFNSDTGAHGVGDNPHNIYSEAIKKKDRPGSKGIFVKENTLYGTGK